MFATPLARNRVGSFPPQLIRLSRATTNPRILIVEDHDDTREMLRLMLEMKGCLVMDACNGLEGVALARRWRPDLILMDGSLPILDGLAATRRIREDVLLRGAFIIAMNGWGTPGYHTAALTAGCDDCMVKPLDFDRLEGYLERLFNQSSLAGV